MTVADAFAIASPGEGVGGGCCLFDTPSKIEGAGEAIFMSLPYSFRTVALCRPAKRLPLIGSVLRLVGS